MVHLFTQQILECKKYTSKTKENKSKETLTVCNPAKTRPNIITISNLPNR